jgi:hypothetical protein
VIHPTTIPESRRRAVFRAFGSLAFGQIASWCVSVGGDGGLGFAILSGGYCLVCLGVNLWIVRAPGAVRLTAEGIKVVRPWGQVDLAWKEITRISRSRVGRFGDLLFAPFTGLAWVEVQRVVGGPSVVIAGSTIGAKALSDLIIERRAEWLARERAIFGDPDSASTPLFPAKAGIHAELGPGPLKAD